MRPPASFKLYAFTVGIKHTRTFAVDNRAGEIADYVLGESGAPKSPVPEDFYDKVAVAQNGVSVMGERELRRVQVSRDSIVLSERSRRPDEALAHLEGPLDRAKHLFPGILAFIGRPKLVFVGMVWEYVKASEEKAGRYSHPHAKFLVDKVLKVGFDPQKEYIGDADARLTFRRRMGEAVVLKGIDDYYNIHIRFRELARSALWPTDEEFKVVGEAEEPAHAVISVDIQHMFDPRRGLETGALDQHFHFCGGFLQQRITTMLRELGFGQE